MPTVTIPFEIGDRVKFPSTKYKPDIYSGIVDGFSGIPDSYDSVRVSVDINHPTGPVSIPLADVRLISRKAARRNAI